MSIPKDSAWYEDKLGDASLEVLLEMITSFPDMEEETKNAFIVLLRERELNSLKEKLADWLSNRNLTTF